MANVGTLVTDAQVIMFVGENATANQIIEANVDFAVLMAEALIFTETNHDFVSDYSNIDANKKQTLAFCAAAKAAEILVNQNVNAWQIATTTIKQNTLNSQYTEAIKRLKETDD